ncbi:MAG: hydroxymethylbilane synthase, partial [Actinobacteria bacterium]|nr:hydroxymethylbilane synthase [Actinomycetota bacterium]
MRPIRIATRGSALALAQAELVARRIVDLGGATSLVPVETSGDTDRQTPVAGLTEMGAFVRAVQRAVLEDRADLAVHSLKDLPLDGPGGLALQAVPERGSPNDALAGASLEELDEGAVVATGSPRRSAQLRWIRPDLRTIELRGNVDTRLRRLAQGEAAAVVLARAGLDRLGHQGIVAQTFTAMEMTPAPGQGALAVEAVPGTPGAEIGAALDDP